MWKETFLSEGQICFQVSFHTQEAALDESICAEKANKRPPRAFCLLSLMKLFLQNPKHKPHHQEILLHGDFSLKRGFSEQRNIYSIYASCLFGRNGGECSIKDLKQCNTQLSTSPGSGLDTETGPRWRPSPGGD